MSVEATFVLFSCDNCKINIGLKSDADWENFEDTWHSGLMYQFCPDCKDKIETQERQLEDEAFSGIFENKEAFNASA